MAFKIVISKKEKTFQKEIKDEQAKALLGLKIGDVFDGRLIGESGKLRITGGSDKEGFPMRNYVEGTRRPLLLLEGGPGYHPRGKGERRKKRVRGNTISEAIVQINTVVFEEKKEEPKKAAIKPETKEEVKPAVPEKMPEEKEEEIEEMEKEEAIEVEKEEEKPKKKPARKKAPAEKKKETVKKPAKKKTTKKVSK